MGSERVASRRQGGPGGGGGGWWLVASGGAASDRIEATCKFLIVSIEAPRERGSSTMVGLLGWARDAAGRANGGFLSSGVRFWICRVCPNSKPARQSAEAGRGSGQGPRVQLCGPLQLISSKLWSR